MALINYSYYLSRYLVSCLSVAIKTVITCQQHIPSGIRTIYLPLERSLTNHGYSNLHIRVVLKHVASVLCLGGS